jgi:CubicO group peptidase (beta-lactamase class C family)
MMSRRQLLTTLILIFSVAALVTAIVAGSRRNRDIMTDEIEETVFRLNDTLTNEMSNIPELLAMDKKVNAYLRKWHMKGASLAITRGDSLVYAKGYGWADEENGLEMSPRHILRMASVSKLITAAGVMVLHDRGELNIKDTVFGPSGILNDSTITALIKDKNYYKITVEHLMRHQGGFRRDPLFSSRDVMNQLHLDHAPEAEDFYRVVLNRRLKFAPGSWQSYSNFGYLLLSKIIEKVSGMPYEEFIRTEVLAPAGCYDMHIAGTYYEDRKDNEVRYYTHEGDGKYIEEYNNSNVMVERCYGGNNIPMLSGAGAWCGSPAEIARFVASIDGRPEVPDIITKESVELMTGYYDRDTFSLGWNDTHPDKGWSRSGTLSGTTALVKLFPDGECWVFISNTSTWKGPRQANYTDALFRSLRQSYSGKLPQRDMFNPENLWIQM